MSKKYPTKYCCPIGLELMRDPVKMENGKTYEKTNILEYLKKHSYKLPITNKVLSPGSISMIEDKDLKKEIDEYKIANKIIDIFIKDVDNNVYTITISSDDTIEKLKKCILEIINSKVKDFFLLYQNTYLSNDKSKLSEYNIERGSMIYVIATFVG